MVLRVDKEMPGISIPAAGWGVEFNMPLVS
jgi:hypothetical protein